MFLLRLTKLETRQTNFWMSGRAKSQLMAQSDYLTVINTGCMTRLGWVSTAIDAGDCDFKELQPIEGWWRRWQPLTFAKLPVVKTWGMLQKPENRRSGSYLSNKRQEFHIAQVSPSIGQQVWQCLFISTLSFLDKSLPIARRRTRILWRYLPNGVIDTPFVTVSVDKHYSRQDNSQL